MVECEIEFGKKNPKHQTQFSIIILLNPIKITLGKQIAKQRGEQKCIYTKNCE